MIIIDNKVIIEFHSVGQGLFHSLTILNDKRFVLVYDCGSYSYRVLEQEIKEFSKKNKYINLLVISHFHYDHINGIPKIFEENIKVKAVIIPYVPVVDRLLLFLEYYDKLKFENIKNLIEFYTNPIEYFLQKDVEKIYLLIPSSEINNTYQNKNKDNLKQKNKKNVLSLDGFIPINVENYIASNSRREDFKIIKEELSRIKKHENVEIVESVGKNLLYDIKSNKIIFEFMFYYPKAKENEKVLKIIEKIKEILKKKDLSYGDILKIIKNESYRNKLKKCIKEVETNHEELNNSSIILFYDKYGESESNGVLLTGDINFDDDSYDLFIKFFKRKLNFMHLVLVPHHGSKKSWNNKLLEDLNNCDYWIISYGLCNRYNHPDKEVIEDISNRKKGKIALVNELVNFKKFYKLG